MHRVILDIEDSAFNKVNYLIQSLSPSDVHIISDEIVTPTVDKTRLRELISKKPLFQSIENPVEWQRELRNEW